MGHPTVERQSSEEQWRAWGPLIESGRWLLCYAQTEAAHGSNLSGLRTTATFVEPGKGMGSQDGDDDGEWEIHTPEPSASKMWIGGSGSTATHAVVMAKMVIRGEDRGMHPFLVPLRDPATHQLLPGRTALDMGPKMGAASMDNGVLSFDAVRIPRTNLLARFQTVDRSGTYAQRNQQAKALMRGTMTLVRVGLCEIAAHHAARATLVAMRYAVVRRQGSSSSSSSSSPLRLEPQIIDYASVQQRLFGAMASSWALTFAARHMRAIYNALQRDLAADRLDTPLLQQVHGHTSVLKAVVTTESLDVVQRCRRSMGGHGYSQASGLSDLEVQQPLANLTYEGDNHMLLAGPAANFLVKQLRSNSSHPPELSYLGDARVTASPASGDDGDRIASQAWQLHVVGHRAARLVQALADLRGARQDSGSGSGKSSSDAKATSIRANLDSNLATRASKAHGHFFILYAFIHTVDAIRAEAGPSSTTTPPMLAALDRLRTLYFLDVCLLAPDALADYTEDGSLGLATIDACRTHRARTLAELRSDALGLCEAFDLDDWYLGSPLGSSDGRAYQRFLDWIRLEPLNQSGPLGARDSDGVLLGFRHTLGRLTHGEATPWNAHDAAQARL